MIMPHFFIYMTSKSKEFQESPKRINDSVSYSVFETVCHRNIDVIF